MDEKLIEMTDVSKSYGKEPVLANMSLNVDKGSIYAFVGMNGAGKTTTIRLLMNMLTPDSGTIRIFGKDSLKDSEQIRSRIGYVPEHPHFYDWMKVDEIIAFTSRFYRTWTSATAEKLLKSLDIPKAKRISELSLGTRAKVGLLLALSHEPELLILDDSTSGLDATVRREFLEHIVSLVEDGTRTIFFSSHIITELERIADRVGLLKDGKLSFEMPVETVKQKVKKINILHDGEIPGEIWKKFDSSILRRETKEHETCIITKDWSDELKSALASQNPRTLDVTDLDLEDIFVEYTRGGRSSS